MLHGCPGVAVRRHPRPSELFKLVNRLARSALSVGWSSGAQAITPDVYLCLKSSESATSATWLGIAPQHLNVLPLLPLPVQVAWMR